MWDTSLSAFQFCKLKTKNQVIYKFKKKNFVENKLINTLRFYLLNRDVHVIRFDQFKFSCFAIPIQDNQLLSFELWKLAANN